MVSFLLTGSRSRIELRRPLSDLDAVLDGALMSLQVRCAELFSRVLVIQALIQAQGLKLSEKRHRLLWMSIYIVLSSSL